MLQLPKLVLHNTISLNGAVKGFPVDRELHYGAAAEIRADAWLVTATTILADDDEIPPETPADRSRPAPVEHDARPLWVVIDGKGRLEGRLHAYRSLPHIRGVLVLTAAAAPDSYRHYLRERGYDFLESGDERVDLPEAFARLKTDYGVHTLMADCGSELGNNLLERNLVHEISLILTPLIVPHGGRSLLHRLERQHNIELELLECRALDDGNIRLRYAIGSTL